MGEGNPKSHTALMPYTTDRDKLDSSFLKRSVKLLECQKTMVSYHHQRGMSIHSLSKLFRVSRRTIQFILYPERQAKNLEDRQKRGGTRQYYDKEKHKEYMKTHRSYKHKTLKK